MTDTCLPPRPAARGRLASPRAGSRPPRAVLLALGLLLAFPPGPAGAVDLREKYEEELVRDELRRRGLELELQPEGKRIERVIVVTNEVLLGTDFGILKRVPLLSRFSALNRLHVTTRSRVIAQELLFKVGQPYRTDLVRESERNLRRLATILSLARIVVARGSAPDRVVLLVVTKDQWSLRLNTEFTLDQARLDYLSFSLAENNLAGRNKLAAIDVALDPGRFTFGGQFLDPRILGTRHYLRVGGDLFFARSDGRLEGGVVSVQVGRPLFSLRTRWSWEASFYYLKDKVRLFRGGAINLLQFGDELVPEIYGRERYQGSVLVSRSFGVVNKINLSMGYRVDSVRYGLTEEFPTEVSDAARLGFVALLPRSEGASGPIVGLQSYTADYVRLRDIDTFALTEDFRLGPEVRLEARYANPYLGLGSHFLALSGSYGHQFYFHDNLLAYSAGAELRVQQDVWPGTSLVNEEVGVAIRNISPRFGPFRLHVRGQLRLRNHDLNNVRIVLGASNGLRGFAPRALRGNNLYLVNVELRTVALNLWTLHVGAVAFYDGGDAPPDWFTLGWHQDAGLGLRILIPQFNRSVLRLDLAFPFELPAGGGYSPRFSAGFDQAF